MLFSIALMLLCALGLSGIMQKLRLPGLLGMLLTGIILGPFAFNLIAPEILGVSAELRQTALIIVLIRAGLSLDINDLKKVGRPAILMCFLPATFEIAATTIIAPLLFDITYPEAMLLGTVLGAVSPAVIVPKMLKLSESGYGKDKAIPSLIMAGASVDDVYVIVLFTSFMGMAGGNNFDYTGLIKIPISIILGLIIGITVGFVLEFAFKKVHIRDTVKIIIILSAAFILVTFEEAVESHIPFSGLPAVIALGGMILRQNQILAKRLSVKFSKLWVAAEIVLFVLVGATVNLENAKQGGITAAILIFAVLAVRFFGVMFCLIKTKLNKKERVFCAVAYMPKATVQAAIGGLPLAAGISAGNVILTVAVLSILITAPLGAVAIEVLYKKLLRNRSKIT